MRLWSVHPKYLDAKGLVALWREGLLAQKVLQGETRGYKNHPQLLRFKQTSNPLAAIRRYLDFVHREALDRNYRFDAAKIGKSRSVLRIPVTTGQMAFERQHLLAKLLTRDAERYASVAAIDNLEVHPMLDLVEGDVAGWEIT
jgi:hypothetical protein